MNIYLTSPPTELTSKETLTFFQNFIKNMDWEHIVTQLITKLILIIITLFILLIVRNIGLRFIDTGFKKTKKEFREQRIETIFAVTRNIFEYTIFFIFVYTTLTILGVPVESLLAGAGIAGVAIGLGAQGFINDLITGFFIILERQLEVGDNVQINDVKGTVEQIGLRTTQIKSPDGTVNFIPNRTILLIKNASRSDMLVQIDLPIHPTEDLECVHQTIQNTNQQLEKTYGESIMSGPNILGLVDDGTGTLVYRITMYVKNGLQHDIYRAYLQNYIDNLKEQNIHLPPSTQTSIYSPVITTKQ